MGTDAVPFSSTSIRASERKEAFGMVLCRPMPLACSNQQPEAERKTTKQQENRKGKRPV